MTLNGVVAVILRYFTEFEELEGILRGWLYLAKNKNRPTHQPHGLFAIAKRFSFLFCLFSGLRA